MLEVTLLDFLDREFTISVLVEGLEDLGKVVFLSLGEELGGDESIGSLLEGLVHTESLHVVENTQGKGLIYSKGTKLNQPWVGEDLLGRWSLILVVGEKL